MEQDEPVDKFVEIVKIGRHFHWYPDVTLYYKSKDRKFKVEGGCKVDVNYKSDFVEIWIAMGHGRHLFKVTRFKRGAYQIEKATGYRHQSDFSCQDELDSLTNMAVLL